VKKEAGMLAVLGLLVMFIALLSDGSFNTEYNLQNLGKHTALLVIFALGEAFVIIAGGIDLSVGAIVGFAAVMTVMTSTGALFPWLRLPIWAAVPLTLSLCAFIGFVQGQLISRVKLAPFIVTLAGMMIVGGLTQVVTDGTSLGFHGQHETFAKLADTVVGIGFLKMPVPFWVLLVVIALTAYLLHFTVFGRYVYALGGNEDAARYSGVPTHKVQVAVYMVSATTAGIAGVLYASYLTSLSYTTGIMYELYAIAACVLGGCSLLGGVGTVLGVLIGGAIMRVLSNGIKLFVLWPGTDHEFRLSSNYEKFIVGTVILAAVLFDVLVKRWNLRKAKG
jgi:ribose transport system permease protein